MTGLDVSPSGRLHGAWSGQSAGRGPDPKIILVYTSKIGVDASKFVRSLGDIIIPARPAYNDSGFCKPANSITEFVAKEVLKRPGLAEEYKDMERASREDVLTAGKLLGVKYIIWMPDEAGGLANGILIFSNSEETVEKAYKVGKAIEELSREVNVDEISPDMFEHLLARKLGLTEDDYLEEGDRIKAELLATYIELIEKVFGIKIDPDELADDEDDWDDDWYYDDDDDSDEC